MVLQKRYCKAESGGDDNVWCCRRGIVRLRVEGMIMYGVAEEVLQG